MKEVTLFSRTVSQFYEYSDESKIKLFDSKMKNLIPNEILIITDLLSFNVNTASVLKMLYNDIEQQLNEKPEVKSNLELLTNQVGDLLRRELLDHELDLVDSEIKLFDLFKILGIRIETASRTIYDKLTDIIQIYKYLKNKRFLVLINVLSYLTKSEITEIIEYIALNQVDVLFVEPREVVGFPQIIIDEDLYTSFS